MTGATGGNTSYCLGTSCSSATSTSAAVSVLIAAPSNVQVDLGVDSNWAKAHPKCALDAKITDDSQHTVSLLSSSPSNTIFTPFVPAYFGSRPMILFGSCTLNVMN